MFLPLCVHFFTTFQRLKPAERDLFVWDSCCLLPADVWALQTHVPPVGAIDLCTFIGGTCFYRSSAQRFCLSNIIKWAVPSKFSRRLDGSKKREARYPQRGKQAAKHVSAKSLIKLELRCKWVWASYNFVLKNSSFFQPFFPPPNTSSTKQRIQSVLSQL